MKNQNLKKSVVVCPDVEDSFDLMIDSINREIEEDNMYWKEIEEDLRNTAFVKRS